MTNIEPTLIASDDSWIEGEALRQLKQTANLPGMTRAVGLPDLHPGKGIPIGAAFLSKDVVYPCLLYTSPSPRDGLLSRMPSSA